MGDFTKRQLVGEKREGNAAMQSTQQSRTANQIIFQDSERRDEGLHHPNSTTGRGKEKIVQGNIGGAGISGSSDPQQESCDVSGGNERAVGGGKYAKSARDS